MPHSSHPHSFSRPRRVVAGASRRSHPERRRSVVVLVCLLLLWSLCLGLGLAQAAEPRSPNTVAQAATPLPASNPVAPAPANPDNAAIGTVDVVSERFQQGQRLYLANCATCHIAIPPAVMPSETWRQLIQDSEHYGATLQPLDALELQILWQYLREYSRPRTEGDSVPYRIYQSKIFKALHPRVDLPTKVNLNSCISCHPGADQYDFRRLSAEWQNAP